MNHPRIRFDKAPGGITLHTDDSRCVIIINPRSAEMLALNYFIEGDKAYVWSRTEPTYFREDADLASIRARLIDLLDTAYRHVEQYEDAVDLVGYYAIRSAYDLVTNAGWDRPAIGH